ncbi:MAG: D-sedoheptulose 7-phosphate isomerase [Bdellovibrionales bacterium]
MDLPTQWQKELEEAQSTLNNFVSDPEQIAKCVEFSKILIDVYKNGGTVFSCGNGGSHCDAMHFAEELTGRYRDDRRPLGALALGDPSHVTCVSNDYGFEHIFSRQLEGLGRPGDALIGLSTSGNSKNVINAFKVAKSKSIKTIALLGKGGGELKQLADLAIVIEGPTSSDRIQEMHIKLIHTVIGSVERELFPENYS